MTETTINCWNTAKEYGGSNIDTVEYNPKTFQFASGVKVSTTSFSNLKVYRWFCAAGAYQRTQGRGTVDTDVQAAENDDGNSEPFWN